MGQESLNQPSSFEEFNSKAMIVKFEDIKDNLFEDLGLSGQDIPEDVIQLWENALSTVEAVSNSNEVTSRESFWQALRRRVNPSKLEQGMQKISQEEYDLIWNSLKE